MTTLGRPAGHTPVESDTIEPRPHCYRCDKPTTLCVCDMIEPVPNQMGVHILQHPREVRHPLGSARLLRVGLEAVTFHRARSKGRQLIVPPLSLPPGTSLLYPSDDARDLATIPPGEHPAHLLVIDGTWSQAHRMVRDNPALQALPCVALSPARPSRYRIRTEPDEQYLSTVEIVVEALRITEPDLTGLETLLDAFETMIDRQIASQAQSNQPPRRKRPRQRASRAIPEVLRDPQRDVVVVYAEAKPAQDTTLPWTVYRLSATRLKPSPPFDHIIASLPAPDPYLLDRLGLERDDLATAVALDAALDALDGDYLAGDDVIVSWQPAVHQLMAQLLPRHDHVHLKSVWAAITHARVPSLAAVLDQLGQTPEPAVIPGRAGERLAQAAAIARHIRQLAQS